MMTAKEIHLYVDTLDPREDICVTYADTIERLKRGDEVVRTTLTHFLQWPYGDKLFVHTCGEVFQITLGECVGTEREIRLAHNIERLLLHGGFDWFDPDYDNELS